MCSRIITASSVVAGDPGPMFLGPFEQLRQVRLQAIPTRHIYHRYGSSGAPTQESGCGHRKGPSSILPKRLVFGCARIGYLYVLKVFTSYQSLTPDKWVGNRHIILRLRLSCLPTGKNSIALFGHFPSRKKQRRRCFLPNLKG